MTCIMCAQPQPQVIDKRASTGDGWLSLHLPGSTRGPLCSSACLERFAALPEMEQMDRQMDGEGWRLCYLEAARARGLYPQDARGEQVYSVQSEPIRDPWRPGDICATPDESLCSCPSCRFERVRIVEAQP